MSFLLHLTQAEVEELDARLLDVIDEYVASDRARLDRPLHRGVFVVHRVPAGARPTPAPGDAG